MEEIEQSLSETKSNGANIVGLVLINPGNLMGQVLSSQGEGYCFILCEAYFGFVV